MWQSEQEDDARLQASYELILEKQTEYGVELVNNADFEAWAGSYCDCYLEEGIAYAYSDQMIASWGSSSDVDS